VYTGSNGWRGSILRLAFSRRLVEQDTFDGFRHLAASFFPIDALDGSFGAGWLSVVHTASPRKFYPEEPIRTKRDKLPKGKPSLLPPARPFTSSRNLAVDNRSAEGYGGH